MKIRFVALLCVIAILGSSCDDGGGGGGTGGGTDEEIAGRTANQFFLSFFGMLTGSRGPDEFINLFEPACRDKASASELAGVLAFIRAFVPDLAKVKIDDVDLGKLEIIRSGEAYLVRPVDPMAIRIKADGKWVDADEYLGSLGFSDSEESPADTEQLAVVVRDGKGYISDCSGLEDFSFGS